MISNECWFLVGGMFIGAATFWAGETFGRRVVTPYLEKRLNVKA